MLTTAILSSQSIGTSTNIGNELTFSTSTMKKTLESTTAAFVVSARLTNGAAGYNPSTRPVIHYATSPFDYAYTLAPAVFRNGARYLELVPSREGAAIVARASLPEIAAGTYIYFWVEVPAVSTAQTLDISLTEFNGSSLGVTLALMNGQFTR